MKKIGGLLLLLLGVSGLAMGHQHHRGWNGREAPEIDLGSGANAVALISGSLLVLRSRRHV
jgi:hypothetical protein